VMWCGVMYKQCLISRTVSSRWRLTFKQVQH